MNYFILSLPLIALFLLAACTHLPASCQDVGGSARNTCIVKEAAGDVKLCHLLKSEALQTWCYNSVANATKSSEPCSYIHDERGREYCQQHLFVALDDLDSCGTLHGTPREGCYEKIAQQRENATICLEMTPGKEREVCIDKVSRDLSDPHSCLFMTKSGARDDCLLSLSLKQGVLDTCWNISDNSLRNSCLLQVALSTNQSDVCENLTQPSVAKICYTHFQD